MRGNEDAIVGCARLLPATHRYLLRDHFRHLVDDLNAAVDVDGMDDAPDFHCGDGGGSAVVSRVWELSRFAWDSPKSDDAPATQKDASMAGTRELLRAAVFTARALGARRLIGVTFVSLARLFVRLGVPTHKLGAAYRIDGRWVAAYRIDLDTQTLAALGLISEITAAQPAAPWGTPCEAADVILPRESTSAT
ncbi:acyl-homoserine-lactone synthase [Pandoraea aquatica]|uniref:acyl-homoserine-lactone synthase n=1 Tax=Pandoraea aquatica TaxID=2508290 RepID=UPI003CCD49BB